MDSLNLQTWLPTLVAGGALAVVWNDMRSTKRQLGLKFDELAQSFKRSLYSEDGRTNFMPRLSCEREQSRCQATTYAKIEALSVKMDLMDAKREHAKDQQFSQMGDVKQALAVLSARVEQLSEDLAQRNVKMGNHNTGNGK